MRCELIVVPYVLGREGVGMGAGPLALAPGLERLLDPAAVHRLALRQPFANEVRASFAVGCADQYASAPGLTHDELVAAAMTVAAELPLAALTLSAYDPVFDRDGAVRAAALAVVEAVTGAART